MTEDQSWADQVAFPALLRAARATYGAAVRKAFAKAGFHDVPRNGAFVLGAIVRTGAPLGHIIKGLGVSKQAGGQLIDTLVVRGYLDRQVDPDDRRRLTISLTERGFAAASASSAAVEAVDAQLLRRVAPDDVARTRAVLAALIDLGEGGGEGD